MSSLTQYLQLYEQNQQMLCSHAPDVLNEAREGACKALRAHGLPTLKTEEYRYFDVQKYLSADYGLNLGRIVSGKDPQKQYRCGVSGLRSALCYVENDVPVMCPKSDELPHGAHVMSLWQAEEQYPSLLCQYYNVVAAQKYDGLAALNTLLVQDGLLVYIEKGVVLENPLQIMNIASARANLMMNRRLLVVMEKDARADIMLCDHAEGTQQHLSTQVSEIYLGEGARLNLYSIEENNAQNTRFHKLSVKQEARSVFVQTDITLSAGRSRQTSEVTLCGEHASAVLNGATVTSDNQVVDNYILVSHDACHCQSQMLYKSVLDGQSTGAFAGKVLVNAGAQKTLSEQTNANLCVSSEAHAYSQPMLEIYADDVKCNHGSTIGKLDEMALFYMKQRGIEEAEARLLLQHAFVNDVLQRIEIEPLRQRISHMVEQRFRGHKDEVCKGCNLCQK